MSTRLISQTLELWVRPYVLRHQMTNNNGGRMNINNYSRLHPYIWFCSLQLICKSGFQGSPTSHFEAVPTLRYSLQLSSLELMRWKETPDTELSKLGCSPFPPRQHYTSHPTPVPLSDRYIHPQLTSAAMTLTTRTVMNAIRS